LVPDRRARCPAEAAPDLNADATGVPGRRSR
jgi:hypothetical protein